MVLKSELNGLDKNVQHFNPRCLKSQEMQKPKQATTLRDTHEETLQEQQTKKALQNLADSIGAVWISLPVFFN